MNPEQAAETLATKIDLFVPEGFRDEDGVWHDGPHKSEATVALAALVERNQRLEAQILSVELRNQELLEINARLAALDAEEHDEIPPPRDSGKPRSHP